MSRADVLFSARRAPQLAALALISFGVAGCSADMSSRLSNPFNYQGDATGAVQQSAPPAQAQSQAERHELPPYARPPQSSSLPPPPVTTPQSYPVANSGVSGGGRGVSSYAPPSQPKLETTASVAPRSVAAARPAGNTKIIVGTSDTLDVLAHRY